MKNGLKMKAVIYGIITFIVLLLFWQIVVIGTKSEIGFPTPIDVITRFFHMLANKVGSYTIWGHTLWSLSRVMIGYLFAGMLGVILGLTMGWFPYIRAIFKPLFDLLRPIAPLAWIPLAILWFGIGEKYKYFLIFIASFVPFTLNSYAGATRVDRQLIGAAKMLGASNKQIFFRMPVCRQ